MQLIKLLLSTTLLLFCTLLVINSDAATYYVKSTGGTCGGASPRCTGLSTAADPGSGTNQACACKYYLQATGHWENGTSGGQAGIITSGDTLIVLDASRVGYDAALTGCSTSYPFGCIARPFPSGADSSHKTKIYGVNQGSCSSISSATELWASERNQYVLNLLGSDNVDIQCLHVTDHSGCRYQSSLNDGDVCNTSSYPYGDYGYIGLKSSDSDSIALKDLWITGMANEGASISTPSNWTLNNVNLWGNAGINYNFNGTGASGTTDQASGTMTFTNGSVAWGGCTLKYPQTSSSYDGITTYDPKWCCSQNQGCTSDGVGTNSNQANWSFDGTVFLHNIADGLDLLYHDIDGATSTVTVKNSKFIGNSGNQIKSGGNTIITNTAVDANCNFFDGKSYTWQYSGTCGTWDSTNESTCETGHAGCEWYSGSSQCLNFSDNCRAGGNAFAFAYQTNTDVYVEGVTVVNAVSDAPFLVVARNIANCASNNLLSIKNSIFTTSASLNWMFVDTACSSATITQDHSVIYGFLSNPSGTGNVYTDPGLSGTILGSSANFLIPSTGSSAYNIADETATNQTSNDMFGYARGANWDTGAIEYGSTDTGSGGSSASGMITGSIRVTGSVRFQ